jgi:hypothetical protein
MHQALTRFALLFALLLASAASAVAQDQPRPYRLQSIPMKERVLWGAELREPEGKGLAFGGQDQRADDGRPHTRLLVAGEWQAIHEELREKNPLQPSHAAAWKLRSNVKDALARARHVYFEGLPLAGQMMMIREQIAPQLESLKEEIEALAAKLPASHDDPYTAGQAQVAKAHLEKAAGLLPTFDERLTADGLTSRHAAQIQLELAAEALDAEPPPRAMQCGVPHRDARSKNPPANTLVYDAKTNLYLLFGGDHLDYLTNDTWVFDPAKRRWEQRHPKLAPPPRANHQLTAKGDGTVRMTGGYVYASNTDYVGGQYLDIGDGDWVYLIEKNQWQPAEGNEHELVAADARVYRTGPFHPQYFLEGEAPDAATFQAWLKEIPANQWVAVNPKQRPELNRDWGVARIDPDRDVMLRWSGGHSAHGGSDVPHFHFAAGRWELPIPVEFPLGQLYDNTEYPSGFNFNLRPWVTGHTYQNYDYDPPSKTMVFTGQERDFFIYDPAIGDWVAKAEKPQAMQYNSCFYTLTLAATPHGAMCWDQNGRVHRYDHKSRSWAALELTRDKLPGAYVDNSSIVYDSQRDRLLVINTLGYGKPFDGQVWAVDMKTSEVKKLSPAGMELADRIAKIDKSCYDPDNDLLLVGSFLKNEPGHTPTPAYDCAKNRWVLLDLAYEVEKNNSYTRRRFPNDRSDALMHDAKRKLIWGCDTNGQVYVLRLVAADANVRPLK